MSTPFGGEYWDIWQEQVGREDWGPISDRTDRSDQEIFQDFMLQAHETELYNDVHPDDSTQFWSEYLDAMVLGITDRDQFFEEWDIDPAEFDWAEWREAMGY